MYIIEFKDELKEDVESGIVCWEDYDMVKYSLYKGRDLEMI